MKRSSMDIGSNTIRLLLAEIDNGRQKRLSMHHRVTRLSGEFNGSLQKTGMNKTIETVTEFAQIAKEADVWPVRAACTGVTRSADNTPLFLKKIQEKSGIKPVVISGETEAHLSAKGARILLNLKSEPFLMFDIGGFSTEIIVVYDGEPVNAVSMELGAVRLTEELLSDPLPKNKQIDNVKTHIKNTIGKQGFDDAVKKFSPKYLVATAGTATSLAAMDLGLQKYESAQVEGYVLSKKRLNELFLRLITLTSENRLKEFPSLEKGREDVLPVGIIICEQMMDYFDFDSILVTEGGLLEGLIEVESMPVG